MASYQIVIIEKKCNGCGDCTIACPAHTSSNMTSEGEEGTILRVRNGKLEVVDQELCDGCGMCLEACPRHALEIKFPSQAKK